MTLDRQATDALHDFISQGLIEITTLFGSCGEVWLIALADDEGDLGAS
jgi:hypothetical protein